MDYRGLNTITRKNRYPIPLISDLLNTPAKARYYTKLDLKHAYHLVRIADGDEWKTAFRTKWGSYEFLVVPFGLCNAPSVWQQFINEVLADLIDVCVVVYLDDILIYSDNLSDHRKHVRDVLRRLRKHRLFCGTEKCEFHVQTVEYLGFILSPSGLTMDEKKVRTITEWPTPRKVKDIQSFLGFCNFYRRFIDNYSHIVVPLTHKNTPWVFSEDCQKSFDTLKTAFRSAPILSHYIPGQPLIVETDASDYALAAILSTIAPDGEMHPIAFHSRTFVGAELNYDTHDKELLAIFDAFHQWRHYLEGSEIPIQVITDHKNLEYFTTTKILTRRQYRWSEFLNQFNIKISFRPGKLGGKPDALTRRWDVYLKEGDNSFSVVNPLNERPVFTQEQLSASLRATLLEEAVLRASETLDTESLHSDILLAYPNDPKLSAGFTKARSDVPGQWTIGEDTGLLYLNGRIYVPDDPALKVRVLQIHHDHLLSGHFGMNWTLARVCQHYVWPGVRTFVCEYVNSCTNCGRNKNRCHRPFGLLRPLPVPVSATN